MTIKINIDRSWVRADIIDGAWPRNVYHTNRVDWEPVFTQMAEAILYCWHYVKGGRSALFICDPALKLNLVTALASLRAK
jgi:hypothetical protein